MKSKALTALGLILFSVLIVLPPLIHGYVYPNLGDDSAEHIRVFELMKSGQPFDVGYLRYLGYSVVGYPIVWISQLTNVSLPTLYLWFCYLSLIGIGLTLYLVTSRIVNRLAGWLSLLIVLWCAQGLLWQFYFGLIFNVINIGLILPWIIYFAVKQEVKYGFYFLIILSFLFGAFHSTGIYLTAASLMVFGLLVVLRLFKKITQVVFGSNIIPAISVAVVSGLSWLYFCFKTPSGVGAVGTSSINLAPVAPYLLGIMSLTVIMLVVFSIFFAKDIIKLLNEESQRLVIILLSFVAILGGVYFFSLFFDPFRQALDLATILAWLVAILTGVFVANHKKNVVMIGVMGGLVAIGLFHNVPAWFEYNSAVREPDKQAIEYLNTHNLTHYNASSTVSYWVYDRYTQAKYDGGESPSVFIERNEPMTPRSDPVNKWFDTSIKRLPPPDNFKVRAFYYDDKVAISIWGNP